MGVNQKVSSGVSGICLGIHQGFTRLFEFFHAYAFHDDDSLMVYELIIKLIIITFAAVHKCIMFEHSSGGNVSC